MGVSPEQRILRDAEELVGLRIAAVRYMTQDECRDFYIGRRSLVLVLSDGTRLYPMADDEGNDAGALTAHSKDGQETIFPVLDRSRTRNRSHNSLPPRSSRE